MKNRLFLALLVISGLGGCQKKLNCPAYTSLRVASPVAVAGAPAAARP